MKAVSDTQRIELNRLYAYQQGPGPTLVNAPGELSPFREPEALVRGDGSTATSGPLTIVTAEVFAAVEEEGINALLGDADEVLVPEDGDVMVYGDGGAGKTTLTLDLGVHLAAGDDWLGIRVPRPRSVLIIEVEGPRPLFRRKVKRKLAGWTGSEIDGRLQVVEEPWAQFTFANEDNRKELADAVRNQGFDVVIVGPLTCAGMDEAGTLQETRAFQALLADARHRAGRHVTFVLIHHESKSGKVSGAWEGTGDTLLHVSPLGRGRTRLYVQKARWSTAFHATTLDLDWTDGDGFAVKSETGLSTEEEVSEAIVSFITDNPGCSWTQVEKASQGVQAERRRVLRDQLFKEGRIVNVVGEVLLDHCPPRKASRLHVTDDPTVAHLRPDTDADGTHVHVEGHAAGATARLRPASPRKGTQDADAVAAPTHALTPGTHKSASDRDADADGVDGLRVAG